MKTRINNRRPRDLREYLARMDPPIHTVNGLVLLSGVPQPRCSEILRGIMIYPKAAERVRLALGIEDRGWFVDLVRASAPAVEPVARRA